MYGTYIGNNKMVVKLGYNGMLTISSKDLSIMPSLVTTGFLEIPLTKYFINQIKPGNTIIDVGTNVGYFTILAAKLVGSQGKVIGYEANPNLLPFVQDNIAMNWLTNQTKLKNIAIYSEKTTLNFHLSEKFHGDSSTQIRSQNENVNDRYTTINVDANSLDNELKGINSIDLLKLDIEGGEYNAFLGMIELLKNRKIKRIVFEWNKIMLGDTANKFIELIEEILFNYNGLLYTLNQNGEQIPATLHSITSVDFYPFALIEFV